MERDVYGHVFESAAANTAAISCVAPSVDLCAMNADWRLARQMKRRSQAKEVPNRPINIVSDTASQTHLSEETCHL